MMIGLLRVGRWAYCVPLIAGVALIAFVTRRRFVTVPGLENLVAAPLLMALVSLLIGLVPLQSSFARLEPSLVRTARMRVVQLFGSWSLVWLGSAVGLTSADEVALVAVLTAIGTIAVVVVGEYSWAVALATGITAVMANDGVTHPVSKALLALPLPFWFALMAAAGICYLAFGPQQTRG